MGHFIAATTAVDVSHLPPPPLPLPLFLASSFNDSNKERSSKKQEALLLSIKRWTKWANLNCNESIFLTITKKGWKDENGHLQCSYRGWFFYGCGSCTRIPQAASQGPEARAVQSPRACATSFPTMVSQGLLFVWPHDNGQERASATNPPHVLHCI
ncbi:hypothetical protein REPUB_Repub14bG0095300 [Reevesia pubescens]